MQPSRTILLASVLKPVDDTRMYGKFAYTLASRPGWQVHVAGRATNGPVSGTISTHHILHGTRLSFDRLRAQLRHWRLLRQLRPSLVIVHAPELLPLTLLWQALGAGRQFLYDIRENYALNIRTQGVYPTWLRWLLAGAVRSIETWAASRAAHLLLAERSYANELPFSTPANSLVLENKYQPPNFQSVPTRPAPFSAGQPLELLYSGTISELNGVLEAVDLARALREVLPTTHLTIIGYCQQPALLARLHQAVAAAAGGITLIGGAHLVPHREVVAAIQRSHIGLLPYHPHPSTARCIPTKLYEYLAHALPVLIPANQLWAEIVGQYQAGAVVDFNKPADAAHTLLAAFTNQAFYPFGPVAEATWEGEGQKLISLVDSIR